MSETLAAVQAAIEQAYQRGLEDGRRERAGASARGSRSPFIVAFLVAFVVLMTAAEDAGHDQAERLRRQLALVDRLHALYEETRSVCLDRGGVPIISIALDGATNQYVNRVTACEFPAAVGGGR